MKAGTFRQPDRPGTGALFEIPLNAVDPNREHVNEAEVLRVLRQHRSEHARDNVAIFLNWRGAHASAPGPNPLPTPTASSIILSPP